MPEPAEKLNSAEARRGQGPGLESREKRAPNQDTREDSLRQKILRDAVGLYKKYLKNGEKIPQDDLGKIRNETRRLPHPWQFKDNVRSSVLDGQLDKFGGVEFARILFDEYDVRIVKDAQDILRFTDFKVPSMNERVEKKMYFRMLLLAIHKEFVKKVASIKAESLPLEEAQKLAELQSVDQHVVNFLMAGDNKAIHAEVVKDELDPAEIKEEVELERLFMKIARPKTEAEILAEIERATEQIAAITEQIAALKTQQDEAVKAENLAEVARIETEIAALQEKIGAETDAQDKAKESSLAGQITALKEEIERDWQLALGEKVQDAAQLIRNIIFLSAYVKELQGKLGKKEMETTEEEELPFEDRAQKLIALFLEEQLPEEKFKKEFAKIQKNIKREELEATQRALIREAKANLEEAESLGSKHKRYKKLTGKAELQEWAAEQLKEQLKRSH